MAKYVFPAIFTKEDNEQYSVLFPDLQGCYTQGDDLEDAYEMAEDVLCLVLYSLEEKGECIPIPSDIKKLNLDENSFATLVKTDTIEYRKMNDNRAVKKTLTIPAWLNTMAESENVNFSAVLQHALKDELHITE